MDFLPTFLPEEKKLAYEITMLYLSECVSVLCPSLSMTETVD
jgi:hypothetical protein